MFQKTIVTPGSADVVMRTTRSLHRNGEDVRCTASTKPAQQWPKQDH